MTWNDLEQRSIIEIGPGPSPLSATDLYTTHVKSINSMVAKCENVLIQSPRIGIPWMNIPINSIMLLNTSICINSTRLKEWLKWFNCSNQSNQYICWLFGKTYFLDLFLENVRFHWPFFLDMIFWINAIDSIIPVPQSQSTQLPTQWKELTQSPIKSEKELWINSIHFSKKMSRFKSFISVELIGNWYTSLVCDMIIMALKDD